MNFADTAPALLRGFGLTLLLTGVSSCIGFSLAVPLALARISARRVVAWPAQIYTGFFRGTPLLVQIYLIYYGLAQFDVVRHSFAWAILRNALPCALIALSLNMAAYVSEVLRAGIQAVPAGEWEAAIAFGMSPAVRMRRIILPRAFRLILPALSNEFIMQLKATALASTITLIDLTGAARHLYAASYSTAPLLVAGLIYAATTWVIASGFRYLERRLGVPR